MHWLRRTAVCIGVTAVAVALATSPPATATTVPAGDLDPAFGVNGVVSTDFGGFDTASATAIQPDGKIVVVGGSNDREDRFAVARYNTNGSLDETFGGDGTVTTDFGPGFAHSEAVGVLPDGKIVVVGGSDRGFAVARYDLDGSLDETFGGGGTVTTLIGGGSFANAMAVQPDGKIVAAGWAVGPQAFSFALARYNDDGSLDRTFGTDGTVRTGFPGFRAPDAIANAIALQPDGKIVAAGQVQDAAARFSVAVARYDIDGSLDQAFGTDGKITTRVGQEDGGAAVALQPDGKVVIAGYVVDGSPESWLLLRYDADGVLDPTFGSGGAVVGPNNSAEAALGVAIQGDAKIVAAGNITGASGTSSLGLRRYNPDGSPDTEFGTDGTAAPAIGGAGSATAVAVQADGRIVAVGSLDNGPDAADFGVFRFLGEALTVQAGGPYSGGEGAAVPLSGTVSDPSASHSWTVVAQSGVDAGAACTVADPAAISTTVTCTDDGVYGVTLRAAGISDTTTLTVDNVAPTVTITSPADGAVVKPGAPVTVTARFTDPGRNDTHSCAVDFGDGTSSAGTVAESAGAGTCTLTHAFSTGGYDVSMTVTDDDGGVGTAAVHVVAAVDGAAFGLRATGPVTVAATPQVSCPPDQAKTTAALNTPIVSVTGLSASCHIDPGTGVTTASATAGTITALGLIHLSGVESTCTSTADGLSGSSRVASINGRPIGTGPGSIGIPGVAQVFFNQTVTGNGQLTQNAIRIHTLLGEDIILASCHLG